MNEYKSRLRTQTRRNYAQTTALRTKASKTARQASPEPVKTARTTTKRLKRTQLEPGSLQTVSAVPAVPTPQEMLIQASAYVDPRLKLEPLIMSSNLKHCDFDYLHMFTPKRKQSASNSSVGFAALKDSAEPDLALKISYHTYDVSSGSLTMEMVNYKLMNLLIANNWTPHVIAYVGSFRCPTSKAVDNLPPDFALAVQLDLREPRSKFMDFLLTEKATRATKLFDWLVDKQHSEIDYLSVLFQILYTFEVFNRIGFRHNDCHADNVFIEDYTGENLVQHYNVDGVVYSVPINYYVKIFDFDRSSFNCDPSLVDPKFGPLIKIYKSYVVSATAVKSCKNPMTDIFCEDFGTCSGINPKYDTFFTFAVIRHVINQTKHKKAQLLIGNFYNKHLAGADSHVFGERFLVSMRGGDYLPTDKEMSSTLQMIQDPKFKQFINTQVIPQYSLP